MPQTVRWVTLRAINPAIKLSVFKPESRHAVIFIHGFLSDKDKPFTMSAARSLSRAGLQAVRFNYRTEFVSDRIRILDEVIEHVSRTVDSIGLVGNSLGGLNAIVASKHSVVKSLALVNPVYDQRNAFDNYVKHHKFLSKIMTKEMKDAFFTIDLKGIIINLKKPVLVLSGDRDKIIPQSLMRTMYDNLKSEKRFVSLRDCGHSIWRPKHIRIAREEIREWFKKCLLPVSQ